MKLGAILGAVEIPEIVGIRVEALCRDFYTAGEKNDWGETVETALVPNAWADWMQDWMRVGNIGRQPIEILRELEIAPRERLTHDLVFTVGVDAHVDKIDGHIACLVLANPGFKFWCKDAKRITPKPGEWFIFNDHQSHSVTPSKGMPEDAVWCSWNVPLKRLGGVKSHA